MYSSQTDTKFFTNDEHNTLLERFRQTLKGTKQFDVLVGYFFSSGFLNICDNFDDVEKIRILIGLGTDSNITQIATNSKNKTLSDVVGIQQSKQDIKTTYEAEVIKEFDNVEDTFEVQSSVDKFKEFLQSGKLEIRVCKDKNVHAKVYISRYYENQVDYGSVITGSSNFSENGLVSQGEFNVQLKDRVDVDFALKQFEDLWHEAVDVKEEYIETINKKTYFNSDITPYELYLKLLYEYFKEELDDNCLSPTFPDVFKKLKYQEDAVRSAKRMLDTYNGVFLADVVGLGKTNITCALLSLYPNEQKLILCPPTLIENWENTINKYGNITKCVGRVKSIGEIDTLNPDKYKNGIVVIDEAHRFRNDGTSTYEKLKEICSGNKVVLVSATPYNNRFADIFSLLKLFQAPRSSTIDGCRNLDNFFKNVVEKRLRKYPEGTAEYFQELKQTSRLITEKILRYVMIRRTRKDLLNKENGWLEDLKIQNITFPKVAKPHKIIYEFNDDIEHRFNETLRLVKDLTYARYVPLKYLIQDRATELFKNDYKIKQQGQTNLAGFMKQILIKRLESSFYAFKCTIKRFIESHEKFINVYNSGYVYCGDDKKIFKYLENEQFEEIEKLIENEDTIKLNSCDFTDDFIINCKKDKEILQQISKLWENVNEEPKLNAILKQFGKILTKYKNNVKIIVFSEAEDTINMLEEQLSKKYSGKILKYSSKSSRQDKERVERNFDPNYQGRGGDDINILVTTDVLAEGVNLHRSNIILNYDLPWNPTKILQRAGRINRVGSEFKKIHVFNCFPTSVADEKLGLEENIKRKIQAFHDVLGSDAKLLTDDEELGNSKELFGQKYLEKVDSYGGEKADSEEENNELRYLALIKNIKDNSKDLYEKIKSLPKKCRTATTSNESRDTLITFFRSGVNGLNKKFIDSSKNDEIGFYDAVKKFECSKTQPKKHINASFHTLLEQNNLTLDNINAQDNMEVGNVDPKILRGRSTEKEVTKIINAISHGQLSDVDNEYCTNFIKALEIGEIAKKTMQKIKNSDAQLLVGNGDYHGAVEILREIIDDDKVRNHAMMLNMHNKKSGDSVILSELFLSGNK